MALMDSIFASVKVNGGASYNLLSGKLNPSKGYMVSIPDYEWITNWYEHIRQDEFHRKFNEYLTKRVWDKILESYSTTYVGMWVIDHVHEPTEICFDLSLNILNKDEAIALGKEYKQLAIYDCENKSIINLSLHGNSNNKDRTSI